LRLFSWRIDVVAIESPGFYAALQTIERLDWRAVDIPVDPVFGLDLKALELALWSYPSVSAGL
jgi:DNA-binding transcriptional MocR family regulator